MTNIGRIILRLGAIELSKCIDPAGKSRQEVKLIGSEAALVTYGEGLDRLAVIERKADGQSSPLGGAELPKVSIGGSTGQELPTALGTVVRFWNCILVAIPLFVPAWDPGSPTVWEQKTRTCPASSRSVPR